MFFLGIIFLWLGIKFSFLIERPVWYSILNEGLVIGGWVFLWEAISLFSFTEFELLFRSRIFSRLHKAPVIFQSVEPE